MAWTSLTYSFGSTLTSTKMTQNQDNFTALAQGSSGAPKIQTAALEQTASSEAVTTACIRDLAVTEAKLSISAIPQSKLKTTTGAVTETLGNRDNVVLPGGSYGFFPATGATTSGGGNGDVQIFHYSGTAVSEAVYMDMDAGPSGSNLTATQRYIQASPPYDLGDGDIPLFIFVLLDSAGKITATYSAPEAPWHYNGPTNITADRYSSDGRGFKKVRQIIAEHGNLRAAIESGIPRATLINRLLNDTDVEIELTQAIKNNDAPVLPHPWIFSKLFGRTPVLLDPVSKQVEQLAVLHHSGESVAQLLHDGYLNISNVPLTRNAPQGVQACRVAWKLT